MVSPSLLAIGFFTIALLARCEAQMEISSFSQIPPEMLAQLSSEQIEGLRQQFNGGGGSMSTTFTFGGQSESGDESSLSESIQTFQIGGGAPGQTMQSMQFSSYSDIPQSILDKLPKDQRATLKKTLTKHPAQRIPGQSTQTQTIQTFQIGGGAPGQATQTMQFSSYSDIPQSILDKLPKDQRATLKKTLAKHPAQTIPGQITQTQTVQTFQIGGGAPGQATQTLQFSSYSDIPQSILDMLPQDQRDTLRITLAKHPAQTIPGQSISVSDDDDYMGYYELPNDSDMIDSGFYDMDDDEDDDIDGEGDSDYTYSISGYSNSENIPTFHIKGHHPGQPVEIMDVSAYSEIPDSVLEKLTNNQRRKISNVLRKKPGKTHSKVPGGNTKQTKTLMNVIKNYVAAGGHLTGVPPVDLLLLRFYIGMGPKNFCK